MAHVYFVTHPDVLIDPAVPVTEWGLSLRGRERMVAGLKQPWVPTLGAIWCSTERKAMEGADVIGDFIGTVPRSLPELDENDRSATGYLPKREFDQMADSFFANPHASVRGWEKAGDAQRRIVAAVAMVLLETAAGHNIAIVSHGGVGTLLLCHLKGCQISRTQDQPGDGGGNYYCFERETGQLRHGWRSIDIA